MPLRSLFKEIEVKFTQHSINYFKVYRSLAFSAFPTLGSCQLSLVSKHSPYSLSNHSPSLLPLSTWQARLYLQTLDFPVLDTLYKGIIEVTFVSDLKFFVFVFN